MPKKTDVVVPRVKLPSEKEKGALPLVAGKEAMRAATDSAEIFQLMEARDEVQMMQEVMGVYSKEYVYDIPFKNDNAPVACDTPNCPLAKRKKGHTHVRGLSWSGIKEARRLFKAIQCQVSEPTLVEHDGKQYYQCAAETVDLRTGNASKAFKRQALKKEKKSGAIIDDPFAYEIVQSKAKRNSIAEILPQPLVKAWIQDWLKGKKDFDPNKAINLRKGEGYTVEDEETKEGQKKLTGAKTASEDQLKKIYAGFRDIEKLGGRSFEESRAVWKKYFGVESLKESTVFQASKLIKTNVENIAKLKKAAAEKEAKEPQNDQPAPKANRAEKIQAIKDALIELGWDLENPTLADSLLNPYDLSSLDDLEKADDATLDAILKDVGGVSK